jgi:predicted PurR-regulated permease PerM
MLNDSQKWLLLAVTLTVGFLLYLLAPVLTPFLAAALLAYLGDPLVDRMEAKGLPRTAAVAVMFVVFLSVMAVLVLLVVPALQQQLMTLASALPVYIEWAQENLAPWLSQTFGIDVSLLDWSALKSAVKTAAQQHWSQVGGAAGGLMSWLSSSGMAVVAALANLVLIPVVTFYLLRDWDHLVLRFRGLLPRKWEATAVQLATDSDTVLGSFLRGQLLVMLALGTVYSLGLWWVGLELALIIGVVAGLVSFVPYLGFIIGILLAGIAAIMQFHEVYYLLLVALVFGVGQALEGMLLTPLLVGDKIGLHPVAVIFAVMAGGQLFGFMGVMLALPAAAVIMVLLRYLHQQYQQSELYAKS